MLDTLPVLEAAPIISVRALPVTIAHQCPAGLQQEARAMQQMWRSALKVILADFATADDARRYLRSTDGQMILDLAGMGGQRLGKLTLQPLVERAQAKRGASEPARAAATAKRLTATPRQHRPDADVRNGVQRPERGASARVWRACTSTQAAGHDVTHAAVMAALGDVDAATISNQLYNWRKYHGLVGA